ncbi:hypothetical protein NQ315_004972 [Exocentrus adspersus]|uniref:RNase H type-1 domain-containing protein n=1 Tax=Exocentrus adspersus TaxID=1586481 RepID=A0AAV8V8I7_9CUCU|nr:hypothetical protein NQ315_004972 [Exocentrus adspersus]
MNEKFVVLDLDVKNCTKERFFTCSDSQAALRAISSPKTRSMLVQEYGDALEFLARQKEVGLVWVPGHMEISGNERADQYWHVSSQGNPLRSWNQSLGSREEVSMGPSVDGPTEDLK